METLKNEIQLAQSKGIDGFALNNNVWREERVDCIYEAAKQVGSSFKLFFSVDMHKDENGYLTLDHLGVRGMAQNYTDVIDERYAWDTSAWPYLDLDKQNTSDSYDRNYLNSTNDVGKVYMASPSPWESSYVAPSLSSSKDTAIVADITHRAFLELGQYYITRYKSCSAPMITQDSIYLFYYTHSKTVVVPGSPCEVSDFSALSDKVYVTTLLTMPASVQLQSGSSSQMFSALTGISTWSMGFQEGQQTAVLSHDGMELSKLVGSKSISNSNVQKYNFNIYSTCTTC
ncbi:hypothetical protein SUGI_1120610 [Cryptomeria japonica]|nr:hypothetical protein SUGI_1120610 [Cryptomeria japonica]